MKVANIRFEDNDKAAVIQLSGTKTGQRYGADQVCVVHSSLAVRILKLACKDLNASDTVLRRTPSAARRALQQLLSFFSFENQHVGWYSLRRGGASAHCQRTGSMEATLVVGRWSSKRTARLHIETGLAETVQLPVTVQQRTLCQCFVYRICSVYS